MSVLRVLLAESVSDLVVYEASDDKACAVLTKAADVQEQEQREIPLDEALRVISRIAEGIEALG